MKIKRWCLSLILYLAVVAVVVTGFSFSRFSTTLANTGAENQSPPPEISFSTWILKAKSTPPEEVLLDNMKPGDKQDISITIQNFEIDANNKTKVSDYNQSVYLALKTTGNLPLVFTLTDDVTHKGIELAAQTTDQYRSGEVQLKANQPETKKLTLTVLWPDSCTDYRYANEIDYLELSLDATQSQTSPSFTAASFTQPSYIINSDDATPSAATQADPAQTDTAPSNAAQTETEPSFSADSFTEPSYIIESNDAAPSDSAAAPSNTATPDTASPDAGTSNAVPTPSDPAPTDSRPS